MAGLPPTTTGQSEAINTRSDYLRAEPPSPDCKIAFNNNPSFMLSNALTSLTNRQFPRAALRFQP
jgi:hypothetical protein